MSLLERLLVRAVDAWGFDVTFLVIGGGVSAALVVALAVLLRVVG